MEKFLSTCYSVTSNNLMSAKKDILSHENKMDLGLFYFHVTI